MDKIKEFLDASPENRDREVLSVIPEEGISAVDIPWKLFGAVANQDQFYNFEMSRHAVQKTIQRLINSGEITVGNQFKLFTNKKVMDYQVRFEFNEYDQIIDFEIKEVEKNSHGSYYVDRFETMKEAVKSALEDVEADIQSSEHTINTVIMAKARTLECKKKLLEMKEKYSNAEER